jgi:hypothetical protein
MPYVPRYSAYTTTDHRYMLFRTKYSQETLESFKSVVHDEKLLQQITGVICNDRWIYFEPKPFDTISEKKIRSIISVKIKRIKGKSRKNFKLFSFQ